LQSKQEQNYTIHWPFQLLYGSENWTTEAREARITAVEMKYMRKISVYIVHIIKQTQTAEELNVAATNKQDAPQ
jgi:hypothetical protein